MVSTLKRILPLILCLMLAVSFFTILNTTPSMAQYVDFDGNDMDIGGVEVPPPGDPVCANCNGAGCEQCQPSTGGDDTGGDDTGGDDTGGGYTGGDDTGDDNTGSDGTGGNDTSGGYTGGDNTGGSDNTGGGYTGSDSSSRLINEKMLE